MLFGRMKLIVVELNTGAELDAMECAELVDGTDHSSGRGRWMERSHDGRRKYEPGVRGSGKGGAGEQRGQNLSWDCERGRTAQSAHERRGRVDEDEP